MKTVLGHTDGIFDGEKIIDKTLQSRSETIDVANAFLNKYSNLVITATFSTYQEGLKSGQLIRIKDTANGTRNIDQTFLIQKVRLREITWGEHKYQVTCSSLLFGMMELLAQLLRSDRKLDVAEDEIINNIIDGSETLLMSDVLLLNNNLTQLAETVTVTDALNTTLTTPPFQWGAGGSPQAYWSLFSWY